jgi:tRNA A-37 threonylcarbamoyl transferase component Bud32
MVVVDVGTRLGGRYQIRQILGQGGMGAVYRASDEVLGKDVALKFVHPSLASGIDRLRDEVLLAQKVTHRYVCRTYDLEEVDGQLLVKMEYVVGETLAALLRRRERLDVAAALAIARAIAEGLAAAHAEGVVHRDLKPHNVLIEEGTERVVLMDFGIARVAGHVAEGLVGTPDYMAPEQVRSGSVDGRADLYALGCVLYQLLVGEVPFHADTAMATALLHVEASAPDPRRRRPDVPEWLAHVILRLLEKDPSRRYPDARSLLTALAGPPPRRWPRMVVAVALATLAVGGALVLGHRRGLSGVRAEWHPVIRPLSAYEENGDASSFSPDGKWLAYPATREGGRRVFVESLETGDARVVTPPDRAVREVRWTRDGSALLVTEVVGQLHRVPREGGALQPIVDQVRSVDDCASGLLMIRMTAPDCPACERLVLRSTSGDERELMRFRPGQHAEGLRCDRAGTQAAFDLGTREGRELWLLRLDGTPARVIVKERSLLLQPAFAPDGQSLVYAALRDDEPSHLFEIAITGGPARQLTRSDAPDLSPDVSPDGRMLVYDVDTTTEGIVAFSTGNRSRRVTLQLQDFEHPAITPDGTELIATTSEHDTPVIVALPVGGGAMRRLGPGFGATVTPDGREIVFQKESSPGVRRILAMPRAGGEPRLIAEVQGLVPKVLVGWDGYVYFMVGKGTGAVAARAPLSGGPMMEEAATAYPFVDVLPGGWRVTFGSRRGGPREPAAVRIIAPGDKVDAPATRSFDALWFDVSPDGKYVLCWDGRQVHRRAVATGDDLLLGEVDDLADRETMALAPDGTTLYVSRPVGQVRRQLITNFADRPPLH